MTRNTSKSRSSVQRSTGSRTGSDKPYVSSFEEQLRAGNEWEPPHEAANAVQKKEAVRSVRTENAAKKEAAASIDVPAPDRIRRSRARQRRKLRAEQRRKLLPKDFHLAGVDIPFVLLLLAVVIVGLIMLFSASYTAAYYKYGDAYHFIGRQAAFTLVGLVIMWIVSRIPYQFLHQLSVPILVTSMVLLVLVLFIGTNNNTEAKRWLVLGPINFQPSEIAKAATIIVFSTLAVRSRNTIKTPTTLLPFLLIMGLTVILLLRQPHLSATIIVIMSGMIVMFLGGASILHLGSLAAVGIVGVYILVFKIGYQYDRIESWLDPWSKSLGDGFQLLQSLYAVGSGGLWGRGLGQSIQKQMYLPEPYNDFIFSIVCEELGFIGAGLVIILFAALYIRGFYIALKSRDTFGTLLVAGFITQLALQTFLNIGVVIGLLPVTGASLPFFSSGGTSLLVLYAEMGVVLGVSRQMTGSEKSQ